MALNSARHLVQQQAELSEQARMLEVETAEPARHAGLPHRAGRLAESQ